MSKERFPLDLEIFQKTVSLAYEDYVEERELPDVQANMLAMWLSTAVSPTEQLMGLLCRARLADIELLHDTLESGEALKPAIEVRVMGRDVLRNAGLEQVGQAA